MGQNQLVRIGPKHSFSWGFGSLTGFWVLGIRLMVVSAYLGTHLFYLIVQCTVSAIMNLFYLKFQYFLTQVTDCCKSYLILIGMTQSIMSSKINFLAANKWQLWAAKVDHCKTAQAAWACLENGKN